MFYSCAVAMDSEIYFIGGYTKTSDLWILDTRSGKLRQGPIMKEPLYLNAVGVADGKIYVIQELKNGEIEEQVFELESQNWNVPGEPVPGEKLDFRPIVASSVSLEGKVYACEYGGITVYNLRKGRRKEKLEMPLDDYVWSICVAENLLFASVNKRGLMWLDTKRNVWRLLSGDVRTLDLKLSCAFAMAEYYGKLAIFCRERDIWCALIALDRVGEGIRGTIEWSGVVATIPYVYRFLHCLVSSD